MIDQTKPSVIITLSGLLGTDEGFDHARRMCDVNVAGSVAVLDAARQIGARYVSVETGTDWESVYSITERCSTALAKAYSKTFGLNVSILKIFNAFGESQSGTREAIRTVPHFSRRAWSDQELPMFGDGAQIADLADVKDYTAALAKVAISSDRRSGFEIIEVGTGQAITVESVARLIIGIIGTGRVEYMPRRRGEGDDYRVADPTRITELLGYRPRFDADRLCAVVNWYQENEA